MSMASDMKELARQKSVSLRPQILEEIKLAASRGFTQVRTTNIQSVWGDVDWLKKLGFHASYIGLEEWVISWA